MASAGEDLRRQSSEADRLAVEVGSVAAQLAALEGMFARVSAEVERLVGGSASAEDRRMRGILASAASTQRTAADHCRSAAETSRAIARSLEARAAEADREEARNAQWSR